MTQFQRFLPVIVVGLAAIVLVVAALPTGDSSAAFQLTKFGQLPVVDGGRIKPLDSVARVNLMLISSGHQEYTDASKESQSAIRWMLDVMTSGPMFQEAVAAGKKYPLPAEKHQVFRIENDQLLQMLDLKRRKGLRYSIDEFGSKVSPLFQMASELEDKKNLDAFQASVMELARHVKVYFKVSRFELMHAIPPKKPGDEWQPILGSGEVSTGSKLWASMLLAYATDKPNEFNAALDEYQTWLDDQPGAVGVDKAGLESYFNHVAPFFVCQWLYVVVIALSCFSWLVWPDGLRKSAFWLGVLVLIVHTWALFMRMYLQGRPPVTNLYSSAVFIGWGCVFLGLLLDVLFKKSHGIGTLVAGVMGFATMILAHHLAGSGDTMDVMQAVLDTNFWLATHVTCITFGYVATLIAAVLGVAYIMAGLFTTALRQPDVQRDWTRMIYGTLCFATLLSFVGTVLGGIWADQSWGRFWGWDPKENGALLIVIMNALVLHARWAGIVKHRGVAVLAVVGAMVTIWSWFGTNQLGVGLHAYGFNKALVMTCNAVWVVCLGMIGMGLVPLRFWRSFAPAATGSPLPKPSRPSGTPSTIPAASS